MNSLILFEIGIIASAVGRDYYSTNLQKGDERISTQQVN
jgi:hypothetical protein